MKKIISTLVILTTLSSQLSITYAETGTLNNEIMAINTAITDGISLDAAPVIASEKVAPIAPINTLTSWELMHRTAMLAGYSWTGVVAQYITPVMYEGTAFGSDIGYLGQNNPFTSYLTGDPTTYEECLSSEVYLSYGLGERIEETDIRELRSIAKSCAKEFYGKYFEGKPYTTREEYIMMLMTMFEEEVSIPGVFSEDGRYLAGASSTDTGYSNVDKKAWFAPYLLIAQETGMISSDDTEWQIARPITDREAIEMLANYTAYRMEYIEFDLEKGVILTEKLKYNITFVSDDEVTIRVQSGEMKNITNPVSPQANQNSGGSRYPGCDTDDIVLSNGQVWAACNVGATKAGTGVESYGSYFQWGRNTTDFTIVKDIPYDWQTRNDRSWGVSPNSGMFFRELGSIETEKDDILLMQGPCAKGYHVPKATEWDMTETVLHATKTWSSDKGFISNTTELINKLLISSAGQKNSSNGLLEYTGGFGTYWTSNPYVNESSNDVLGFRGYSVGIGGDGMDTRVQIKRATGASIRCLKN